MSEQKTDFKNNIVTNKIMSQPLSQKGKPLSMTPSAIRQREYRAKKKAEREANNQDDTKIESKKRKERRQKVKETKEQKEYEMKEFFGDEAEDIVDEAKEQLSRKKSKRDIDKFLKEVKNKLIETLKKDRPVLSLPEIKEFIEEKTEQIRSEINDGENCEELVQRMYQKIKDSGKKKVGLKAIRDYNTSVEQLYKQMYNKKFDCQSYDWLSDAPKIVKFILNRKQRSGKAYAVNSNNTMINNITSFLKNLSGHEEIYRKWSKINIEKAKESQKVIKSNRLSDKQADNWVDWKEVKEVHQKIDASDSNTKIRDHALLGLYTHLDLGVRRNEPFTQMKVIVSNKYSDTTLKSDKKIPEDWIKSSELVHEDRGNNYNNYNYLIMRGTNVKMILQRYKTDKHHKEAYERNINDTSLKKWLKEYVTKQKAMKDGDPLFQPERTKKHLSRSTYSGLVTSAFNKYLGKKIGSQLLRHIYINEKTDDPNMNVNDREELAESMGHNISTQAVYRKNLNEPPLSSKQPKKKKNKKRARGGKNKPGPQTRSSGITYKIN